MKSLVGVILSLFLIIPLPAYAATQPLCSLCILEIGTLGLNGQEDQDFVIIANVTTASITSSSIQLRYFNSAGVLDSVLGIGTFTPGQIKVYAADSLRDVNPNATRLTLPLYSGGGKLQIARSTSTTTTIYDQLAWGNASAAEGSLAAVSVAGTTLARRIVDGVTVDTNQNANDFMPTQPLCQGATLSEIQPYVSDESGKTIDAWVELIGTTQDKGDCRLLTAAGDTYTIPANSMPSVGEFATIREVVASDGSMVPLHLGEDSGHVWLAGQSVYGGTNAVQMSYGDQAFTNLSKGQSWALISGTWRRTYMPTPDDQNVYQAESAFVVDDPTACSALKISELLPNPAGDDVGHEWIELHNESAEVESLTNCGISVADDMYYFLGDDTIGPDEWRVIPSLYDATGNDKKISLKNSGETVVALKRLRADGTSETMQSFAYSDALDGESWARFDEGWKWSVPSPGVDNTQQVTSQTESLTETPAPTTLAGDVDFNYTPPEQALQITELLPNPAAPETDDIDEFIEIYNPNEQPVTLTNFKLQAGSSYSYSYTLKDQVVPAAGYLVLKSAETHLTLSNTSGRARLLDPNGQVMAETDPYESAPEGQSWVFADGVWKWSGTPTAGVANKVTIPLLAISSKATKAAASKNTKAAAPKVLAKTTAAKKTSQAAPKAAKQSASNQPLVKSVPSIHKSLLAVAGVLAVGYAIYEYRQDIANRVYQFRRYRAARRASRSVSSGR